MTNKLVHRVGLDELYNFCPRDVLEILLRKRVMKARRLQYHFPKKLVVLLPSNLYNFFPEPNFDPFPGTKIIELIEIYTIHWFVFYMAARNSQVSPKLYHYQKK